MHVQLDPVGGIAGDMFAAAVLDAWPEFEPALVAALERAGLDAIATVERIDHADHALTGSRFAVHETGRPGPGRQARDHDGGHVPDDGGHVPDDGGHAPDGGSHAPDSGGHAPDSGDHALDGGGHAPDGGSHPPDGGGHAPDDGGHAPGDTSSHHRHRAGTRAHGHDSGHGRAPAPPHHLYRDIRVLLDGADLDPGVRARALDMFARLAVAESAVHGVPVEDVSFHEVGAYDSIADVVCAAWLIERLGATWSCGPLPIGRGRADTSHGQLPIPAPATVELLRGMVVDQDAHLGERVTPTGAAIVAHLAPSFEPLPGPMRLERCGTGFGASRLPGTSNVLRLLAFDAPGSHGGQPGASVRRERIAVCEFEIDDQTAEDLALALDRLRDLDGVLDVSSHAMHGKKARLAVHVRLLARLAAVEAVLESCFRETTTLGVRWHEVSRATLARESRTVTVEGRTVRVKSAYRPGGTARTAKVEIDDLAKVAGGHAERERLRASAERAGGGDGP